MNFNKPPSQNTSGTQVLRVRVKKIYFEEEETDFYIFQALDLDHHETKNRKIKGYFFSPRIYPGVELKVRGIWEKHPKYGYTFKADFSDPIYDGIEAKLNYLESQLLSCGPINARKILNSFGDDTFDILDKEPQKLETLPFLTVDKARALAREWRDSRAYGQVAKHLLSLGLPSRLVKRIFSMLGHNTLDIVKDNPYELALVEGVDFPTADKIALNMGFSRDSEFRIASILEFLLKTASNQRGHLYLPKDRLLRALNKLPSSKGIVSYGRTLLQSDVDKALKERENKNRLVVEDNKVYLQWNYQVEHESAVKLSKFSGDRILNVKTDEFISEYERIYDVKFSSQQEDAIKALNDNKVLLLTGLPGTGKTFLVKSLVRLFKQANKKFQLMSPTGIAAKRMSTVVGEKAGTIHRTLGYSPDGTWKYNDTNKYDIDAVIVDECCLPYKQYVMLADGSREYIGTIVHQRKDVEVLSYNTETGEIEPKRVVNWFKYPRNFESPLLEIKSSKTTSRSRQRIVRCTANHKLYLASGEQKKASDISIGDKLRVRGNFLNPTQRSFLLGSLFGDACIAKKGNSPYISFIHGEDQEAYLLKKKWLFKGGTVQENPSGFNPKRSTFLTSAHSIDGLCDIYSLFYPKGNKIVTKEALEELDEVSLASWYMDDGSLAKCGDGFACMFHTEGFTKEDNEKIKQFFLRKWGLDISVYMNGSRGHYYLRMKKDSSQRFLKMIAPWVFPCMSYKIPDHLECGTAWEGVSNPNKFRSSGERPVNSISTYEPSRPKKWVYDIEIEGNHNYFTNNVLVSNSMVDQELLYRLLSALKEDTILVFVGDNNQLPSVGAGNVLHEMITSDSIKRVHLNRIYRQAKASDIVINAHRINEGKELELGDPTSKDTDFRFVEEGDPSKIIKGILHVVDKLYQKDNDCTFQVLSPTYKGPLGVNVLNEDIKDLLNPSHSSKREVNLGGGTFFREKDRVMVVENDYDNNVFNGEIGNIYKIDKKNKKIKIKIFDNPKDRILELSYMEAKRLLTLAYALTIHKCQGNDFDYVIFPFHKRFSIQLQRNLLYTAVTRAKKKVFVFGQWRALNRAINNDEVSRRNTAFAQRLKDLTE